MANFWQDFLGALNDELLKCNERNIQSRLQQLEEITSLEVSRIHLLQCSDFEKQLMLKQLSINVQCQLNRLNIQLNQVDALKFVNTIYKNLK